MKGSISTDIKHEFYWDRTDSDQQTAMKVSVQGMIATLQFGTDDKRTLLDKDELEALRRLLAKAARVIR